MAGIVQMLHRLHTPYDKYLRMRQKDLIMPTEREYDKHNPEIKSDHRPAWRARFLDHSVPQEGTRLILGIVISVLALYGLYSIFF